MKVQCIEHITLPKCNPMTHMNKLISAPEIQPLSERIDDQSPEQAEEEEELQQQPHVGRFRCKSFEIGDYSEEHDENIHVVVPGNALRSVKLLEHDHDDEKTKELINDKPKTDGQSS